VSLVGFKEAPPYHTHSADRSVEVWVGELDGVLCVHLSCEGTFTVRQVRRLIEALDAAVSPDLLRKLRPIARARRKTRREQRARYERERAQRGETDEAVDAYVEEVRRGER
jgi:hypothetical protein